MVELGQLEKHQAEFASRHVRILAVSLEGRDDAAKTQAQFPHLVVIADKDRQLIETASVIHEHMAPDGGDTATPATILVDGKGVVRWVSRPDRFLVRLTPEAVLAAVDQNLH
jgi:peroxiredoxin